MPDRQISAIAGFAGYGSTILSGDMTPASQQLRVTLAQINAVVGDIEGNAAKIRAQIEAASADDAQVVVFPELALTGYPPEDLLLKTHFLDAARAALDRLAAEVGDVVALVGFPERSDDVYNAAAVLAEGRVAAVYRKMFLPNYGVFDEQRYFQAGPEPALIEVAGVRIGLTICEDLWEPGPPATTEALSGAQVIVNLSASPYHAGKPLQRERMLVQRARDNLAVVAFCNLVGGQDELVFDGHSVVIDHAGTVQARAPQFEEALVIATVDPTAAGAARLRDSRHRAAVRRRRARGSSPLEPIATLTVSALTGSKPGGELVEPFEPVEEIYTALVMGLRDYVRKNGFGGVVLGLSGGIDSTLVALLAADALGAEQVATVVMPSPYSTSATQEDARALARNLGVRPFEYDIATAMKAFDDLLAPSFADVEPDVTEENIQARIRGILVMALSNKFGWLVLTTGNKSEMSVGYTTLYGDMAGGFAVLKDVYKGWVYRLVEWRNERAGGDLVPADIATRPPSAELRPDQRDEDSLPPYEVLDGILYGYIEGDLGSEQLVQRGFPKEDVERVIALVDRAEYKRRQAPPGIRISTRAFGRDRRLPITNRWRS